MPYKDAAKGVAARREYYEKNKAVINERANARKRSIMAWVNDIKAQSGCSSCEENHPACLDFHHTDPSKKEQEISRMVRAGKGMAKIQKEIDKCVLLCANCHRKQHWGVAQR